MKSFLQKLIPLVGGLLIFIAVSWYVRNHTEMFASLIEGSTMLWGMAIFVILGIATVMIPFGSLVPFVPIAVTLWGWEMAAFLTFLGWLLGSQILFEFARAFGKPFVQKMVPDHHLNAIKDLISDKGLFHSILIRLFTHGDLVSYAFGIFTHVKRWEFLIITAIGLLPGAITAAYIGKLELRYQIGMAIIGVSVLGLYWFLEWKRPQWLRKVGLLKKAA